MKTIRVWNDELGQYVEVVYKGEIPNTVRVNNMVFEVMPLMGGRYKVHRIDPPAKISHITTTETCDCQWFASGHFPCNHILAVRKYLEMREVKE